MDRVGKFNDALKSSGDKDFGNRTDKAGLEAARRHGGRPTPGDTATVAAWGYVSDAA